MCIIAFISYYPAHFLHQDRSTLAYACIVWESHESWTYRCIILSLFFLPLLFCISSHLIGHILHPFFFVLSTACFVSYSLHPEWWPSSVHYMEDSHVFSTIYLTDTDSEILSLRKPSRQREFFVTLALESVSIHHWYHLLGLFVHVQGVCICIYVKKKNEWWMMNEKKKRKKEKKYENQLKEKKNKHMCVCA